MFISFTYRCPDCGMEEDRFVKRAEMDEQFCSSTDIDPHRPMTRLPPATRTTFRYADTKLKG